MQEEDKQLNENESFSSCVANDGRIFSLATEKGILSTTQDCAIITQPLLKSAIEH